MNAISQLGSTDTSSYSRIILYVNYSNQSGSKIKMYLFYASVIADGFFFNISIEEFC